MKTIHERITADVLALSDRRRAEHESQDDAVGPYRPLPVPVRTTVRNAMRKLDEFAVMLAREGEDAMREKLRPVEDGLIVTRPLEVVMLDEHTLDFIAFFGENNWR